MADNAPQSNDMVDSGVGSQHKCTGKEIATGMDEDEDISLSCEDRPHLENVEEKEIDVAAGDDIENPSGDRNDEDDDKKDDEAS